MTKTDPQADMVEASRSELTMLKVYFDLFGVLILFVWQQKCHPASKIIKT